MNEREQLINEITERVLACLCGAEGECADCEGSCAACCSDKVRAMVESGARRVSYNGAGGEVPSDLAQYIDHTLLKPDATADDIDRLCDEAMEYGFAAVCVNPFWVPRAAARVRNTAVRVASVVGFPSGAHSADVKAMETRRALRDGAREIDMVINVGALKSRDYEAVEDDIAKVADACREVGARCKVILETGLLTDEEKVIASRLSKSAKAHFVKTSTGFGHGGAELYDVALMHEAVGGELEVKASGGIKTAEQVRQFLDVGATRIGASAGIAIVSGNNGGNGKDSARGGY